MLQNHVRVKAGNIHCNADTSGDAHEDGQEDVGGDVLEQLAPVVAVRPETVVPVVADYGPWSPGMVSTVGRKQNVIPSGQLAFQRSDIEVVRLLERVE